MSFTLNKNIIVATDLDGTLLDHFSYACDAAIPALRYLKERDIPVVINTSKTYAEVKKLQAALNLEAAFIVENGSAIYIDRRVPFSEKFDEYDREFNRIVLGAERKHVIELISNLRSAYQYKFESYADWDVQSLVDITGLNEEDALLSMDRQFSEPLIWNDTKERFSEFSDQLSTHGLRTIRGGRFTHILGASDKGASLSKLTTILFSNQPCSLIGLGDGPNDLEMLNVADIPVLIRSPAHDFPNYSGENEGIYTKNYGPEGWNEAIQLIFNQEF